MTDPVTGKGFSNFYQKSKDGRGFLEAPAPPGTPVFLGRRYELVPP